MGHVRDATRLDGAWKSLRRMSESQTHRRKKTNKRSKPRAPLSPQEKVRYIDLITRDFVAGLTVKAIAAKHNISTASIYRWCRQRDDIERHINAETMAPQLNIEGALQILISDLRVPEILKREALFQFLVWIRWPTNRGFHTPALINCIASYLKQRHNVVAIKALPSHEADVLLSYITLDVAARFSSPNAAFNPDFEIVTNQKSRYDDRQFFAEIVSYLLTEENNGHSRRPTLDHLQILVKEGAFGVGWSMSPRTFEKFWRSRVASFPFLYVEQYHSPFDWSLNPSDADFAQSVDEIVETLDGMRTYLGRVKWVIRELELRLDPRAVRHINFPKLPDQVEAMRTVPPALKPRLLAKIAELV